MRLFNFIAVMLCLFSSCRETIDVDLTSSVSNDGNTATTIIVANNPLNITAKQDVVSEVGQTSATIIGVFTKLDEASRIIEHGHCWSSKYQSPTITNSEGHSALGIVDKVKSFITTIKDLKPTTLYYVRAYVITEGGRIAYLPTITKFKTL